MFFRQLIRAARTPTLRGPTVTRHVFIKQKNRVLEDSGENDLVIGSKEGDEKTKDYMGSLMFQRMAACEKLRRVATPSSENFREVDWENIHQIFRNSASTLDAATDADRIIVEKALESLLEPLQEMAQAATGQPSEDSWSSFQSVLSAFSNALQGGKISRQLDSGYFFVNFLATYFSHVGHSTTPNLWPTFLDIFKHYIQKGLFIDLTNVRWQLSALNTSNSRIAVAYLKDLCEIVDPIIEQNVQQQPVSRNFLPFRSSFDRKELSSFFRQLDTEKASIECRFRIYPEKNANVVQIEEVRWYFRSTVPMVHVENFAISMARFFSYARLFLEIPRAVSMMHSRTLGLFQSISDFAVTVDRYSDVFLGCPPLLWRFAFSNTSYIVNTTYKIPVQKYSFLLHSCKQFFEAQKITKENLFYCSSIMMALACRTGIHKNLVHGRQPTREEVLVVLKKWAPLIATEGQEQIDYFVEALASVFKVFLEVNFNTEEVLKMAQILPDVENLLVAASPFSLQMLLAPLAIVLDRVGQSQEAPATVKKAVALVIEQLLIKLPTIKDSELVLLAETYQLCTPHVQPKTQTFFLEKYTSATDLEYMVRCLTFWKAFMSYGSANDIMREASRLKKLQSIVKVDVMVADFLERSKNNIPAITDMIDALSTQQITSRFCVPRYRQGAVYNVKSTKRTLEQLIMEMGAQLIQDVDRPSSGLLDDAPHAFILLAQAIDQVYSTYNFPQNLDLIRRTMGVVRKHKSELTYPELYICCDLITSSNYGIEGQEDVKEIIKMMISHLANPQNDFAKRINNTFMVSHVAMMTDFQFDDVDYSGLLNQILSGYLNVDRANPFHRRMICLRGLFYFIPSSLQASELIVRQMDSDVDTLEKRDVMKKGILAEFKSLLMAALAIQTYHPSLAPQAQKINDRLNAFRANHPRVTREYHPAPLDSNIQNQAEGLLKRFDIPYESEKLVGFSYVDFFIAPNIVLEILGQKHFIFGKLDSLSEMKRTILVSLGYRCIYVNDTYLKNFENQAKLIKHIQKIREEQLGKSEAGAQPGSLDQPEASPAPKKTPAPKDSPRATSQPRPATFRKAPFGKN